MSNYATKSDLKDATGIDTSNFALKSNFSSLKTEVDKLDIGKLIPVLVDLGKLSDAVKNEVVKETVYDKLVTKVNNIDTSGFVLKTKYNADKSELEKKIPDTSWFVKKTDYSAEISEIESKIPSTSGLATTSALAAVKNKIAHVSSLVKKTDYNTKISGTEKKVSDHNHDKYITTPEFNKFTAEVFDAKLARANLIAKTDFDTKLISLNSKINSNKTKHVLFENELKKLQTFDSIHFIGKNYFEEDGTENYLEFQLMHKYFKKISDTNRISEWKSNCLMNLLNPLVQMIIVLLQN